MWRAVATDVTSMANIFDGHEIKDLCLFVVKLGLTQLGLAEEGH